MILTYVNNHKLFIQFDRIIKTGIISLNDGFNFNKKKVINNSEFEIIELPEKVRTINISIEIGNEQLTRIIKTE
jgi:hypothetical protein